MCPVSRGRKPKKTRARGKLELPPLVVAADECDRPAGLPRPEPGVDELVDGFLASAAEARGSDDPYDAEVFGATVLALSHLGPGPADALLEIIQPVVEARATEDAVALLLAVGAIAPGEAGRAATSAASGLVAGGLRGPRWAWELTTPVTFDEGCRLAHPSSELSVLAGVFTRAQRSHAFLVILDEGDRGAARDIITVDTENLPEALAMLEADARRGGIELVREKLDAAEFRRQARTALDTKAADDGDLDFLDAAEEMRSAEPDIPPLPGAGRRVAGQAERPARARRAGPGPRHDRPVMSPGTEPPVEPRLEPPAATRRYPDPAGTLRNTPGSAADPPRRAGDGPRRHFGEARVAHQHGST